MSMDSAGSEEEPEGMDWYSGQDIPEDKSDSGNSVGDYLLGQVLGKGSQGIVYKALHIKTGKFVAVKEIFCDESNLKGSQVIREEIKMLSEINHPNIIKYREILRKGNNICIVMEYIESGSIKDIIHRFGNFPESLAAVYVKQILEGLAYLHGRKIIHRDIKGGNILITKNGTCKLADFGLAQTNVTDLTSIGPAGTTYWMAPELFDVEIGNIGPPSDIWSLGATIVELITGMPPYQSLGPLAAIYQIAEGEISPIPIGISDELASFLEGCFVRNPKHRMSAFELLNHQWVTGKIITPSSIKQSGNFGKLVKALKDYRESGENRNISVSSGSSGLIRRSSFRSKSKIKRRQLMDVFGDQSSPTHNTSLDEVAPPQHQEIRKLLVEISCNPSNLQEMCKSLSMKVEAVLEANLQFENELTLANKETEQLANDWKKGTEEVDELRRGNHYLREKIQFLEANINMTDLEMAKILYGDELFWEGFPETTKRGVLKLSRGSKWRKRLVALRDNFIFLYRPANLETPCDCVKLIDVVISTDHRKLHPNSFSVHTNGRQMLFCAANSQIMTQWMQALSFTKPWYEEVPSNAVDSQKPSTRRFGKVEKSRSNKSAVIQLARNTLRKYSTGQ